MQGVNQLPTVQSAHQPGSRRVARIAWVVLLLSFALFCTLVIAAGYVAWHYRVQAMAPQHSTLIARAPTEWIAWKRKGRSAFERPVNLETQMPEGAEVRIDRSAGYGQAATVRLFDQSTLDLWAGADLILNQVQTSRWNNHQQTVVLRQIDGYVRYDLKTDQPFQNVEYLVKAGQTTIRLGAGGSYSIEVHPPDRQVHLLENVAVDPVSVDVAVREGIAEVQGQGRTVKLAAGQRVEVAPAGAPSLPVPARWELIRDGTFSRFTETEYNNTTFPEQAALVSADSWQVTSRADPGAIPNGFFTLARSCPPPNPTTDCDPRQWRNAAGFMRTGDQTKSFVTGVRQMLGPAQEGLDISEYRSLVFSAWVRVLYQSIPLTGERGTECPVMIRFVAKKSSPSDPEQDPVICVYSSNNPDLEPVRDPNVQYYRVAPFEWYHLQIELRADEWLPEASYLRNIDIYANGHDYNSRVTEVSLIGSHISLTTDDE